MVKEVACTIAQSKKEPGWQRREVFWTDAFRNGELIWPYVRRVASWARKETYAYCNCQERHLHA